MLCPRCDGSRFYYVQRVFEYHEIESIEDGEVILQNLNDAVVDTEYASNFYCEDCNLHFDMDLNDMKSEDVPI